MGRHVGIDLGTTNSVIAVLDGPQPRVLDTQEGRPQARSITSLRKGRAGREDEILVGDVALDNWPMAPRDTIYSIKRLMGRAVDDPEVQRLKEWALYEIREPSSGTKDSVRVVMGDKEYSPEEISAMILRKLKEDAKLRLGEEVTHAVITVPAYFSQAQKAATREAGRKAGLTVIKVLEEPTAAAVCYGREWVNDGKPRTIVVYDLGGGTFDISVLVMTNNVFAPLNLQGDMWLGGDDFDRALVNEVLARIKKEYQMDPAGDMRFLIELREKARAVKERLSSARAADLVLAGMLRDKRDNLIDVDMEVTQQELERLTRSLVERTVQLTRLAIRNAEFVDEKGEPDLSPIDLVLMAGNATNARLVQVTIEAMFGKERVVRRVHPKLSVALGAAIVAAAYDIVCQAPDPADPEGKRECGHPNSEDAITCARCGAELPRAHAGADADGHVFVPPIGIAPYDYGMQSAGDRFNVFVEKNDVCPTPLEKRRPQPFYTRMPGQRIVSVPVYGGDHRDKASANEKQGEALGILAAGLPAGTELLISIWLDGDGIFDLEAHLGEGTPVRHRIVKGGADQKAADALQKAEELLGILAEHLPHDQLADLEAFRDGVLDKWVEGDFEGALHDAEELTRRMEDIPRNGDRLMGLIRYTEFVLQSYAWGLRPEHAFRLNRLLEEAREAMASGDQQQKDDVFGKLDQATERDGLGEPVWSLVNLRMAISNRIHPYDVVAAANLREELDEIENAFKSHRPDAIPKLNSFVDKVVAKVKEIEERRPGAARCPNPNCGREIARGVRKCPHCGEDTWIPEHRKRGTTGEIRA